MKHRESHRGSAPAVGEKSAPTEIELGCIPGLERLLPGRYMAGDTVRSRYGQWILPRSYKGRRISVIVNGTMFG